MDKYLSDEDAVYEEASKRERDSNTSLQPQYEDTDLPEREYEDS